MRNLTLCMLLAAALVMAQTALVMGQFPGPCEPSADNGEDWCDDFESYHLGPIHGLNGWEGWGAPPDPSVCSDVVNDQNHTPMGSQCIGIALEDDTVRVYNGYDDAGSDYWTMAAWVYYPTTTSGDVSYLVLNQYDGGGAGTNWSVFLQMNREAGTILSEWGGETLPLITDQWVEIRCEIDFVNDFNIIYYNNTFLVGQSWTEAVSGGGILNIALLDLYSSTGSPLVYFDDCWLFATEPDPWPAPRLSCNMVEYLDNGCAEFSWSAKNVNIGDPITTFYLDIEAGTGGQICNAIADIVPPAGFTVEDCTGWVNGHTLFRFTGPAFLPGQEVYGRLTVDTNGDTATLSDSGLTIPPFSIMLHAAQETDNPDAVCAPGDFSFGPTGAGKWSAPPSICTAYLPVPTTSTWARILLATLLVGGGALLVLRSRRPVAA